LHFVIKENKVVEIWHHVTQHVETFSLRIRRDVYLKPLSQKSNPAVRCGYTVFL